MPGRLTRVLDGIEQEFEAPIYALERLREAWSVDAAVTPADAKRLRALDKSGAGRALGAGWATFYQAAVKKPARGH
jgi:hypothetical protein